MFEPSKRMLTLHCQCAVTWGHMQLHKHGNASLRTQTQTRMYVRTKAVAFMWFVSVTTCASRNKILTNYCWKYPFYDTTVLVIFYLFKVFMVVNIFLMQCKLLVPSQCMWLSRIYKPNNHKLIFFLDALLWRKSMILFVLVFLCKHKIDKTVLYWIVLHAIFSKIPYLIADLIAVLSITFFCVKENHFPWV